MIVKAKCEECNSLQFRITEFHKANDEIDDIILAECMECRTIYYVINADLCNLPWRKFNE